MLTGASGAGKTTVLRLLLRFFEPASGTALIGGTDLAAVPVGPWRAQIAWVLQHPRLPRGSVADNIALRRPDSARLTRHRTSHMIAATGLTCRYLYPRLSPVI